MKTFILIRLAGTLLGLTVSISALVGCGGRAIVDEGAPDELDVAQAMLQIARPPDDVQCLVVAAASASRTVQRRIDVSPGQPVSVVLSGLPTGSVSLGATAYPQSCSAVTSSSQPTWLSDPLTETMTLTRGVLTSWNPVLRPNGLVNATVSWEDDDPGPYTVQGEYLLSPDRAVDMLKSLADFRVKARDDVNGGFFTYTKLDGTVGSDRRKGFVTQTRDAWTMSRAFMVTGDEVYLDHAAHALEHLYSHGWDNTYGGWYFIGDELGTVSTTGWGNQNSSKGSFIQHYALLGMGAACDATRDATTCSWLEKGRSFLDEKMWDSNPAQLGYYDTGSLDLSTVQSKSFTATVDAMTTHGLQIELLWQNNPAYRQRLLDLADIVTDRLAANMDLNIANLGFPENYKTDWSVDRQQTGGWVGHVLKSAWVLARVYLRHPDERYRTAARNLIYEVLNNGGWNDTYGVPYTNTNWASAWVDTTQAECWEIEQAIVGGLANWYIADDQSDKNTFLRMADRSLSYMVTNVVDHVNGGTYKMNNIDGSPKTTQKGNEYNVEYHSAETFYFVYLYGNLMLHRRPVTLYYRVAPSPNPQVLQLNPVAIDNASLQIKSVMLDGAPLTTFSGPTRELTLEANQGGKLAVVFGPAE